MFKKVFLQELDTAFHHGNHPCMQNYVCVVWLTTCIAAAPSEHRVFHTLWGLQLPVTEVVLQTLKNLR